MKTDSLPRPLLAGAGVAVALLVLLDFSGTAQAWQHLQQSRQTSAVAASQLADMHGLVQRNRALLQRSLQTAALPDGRLAEVEANIERISARWASTVPLLQEREEGWLAGAVATQRLQYLQQGLLPVLQALRSQTADPQHVQPLAQHALALYAPLDQSLGALRAREAERARQVRQATQAQWHAALQNLALLGGLLLL
ncbi:MAG: Tar ligand binding domain-containing protein, partial [Rhodoferax sp.]|nr:Tar ligand binding domain-containing protein [Rhodoferax sp.]